MNTLLNPASKISNYSVVIGGVDLIKESIISIDVSYRNYTPKVLGRIIINDIYDLNSQYIWRDQKVNIFYMDIYDKYVQKEFTIINIHEKYDDRFNKTFVLDLQDTFSYVLEHSYASKGFKTNPITALTTYINDYLKLNTYVDSTTSKINFSSISTSYDFVVPKHINNLEWFLYEFKKHGYSFYQNKQEIVVKSLTDLVPKSLPLNDTQPFTNETGNQFYKNRINELRTTFNQRSKILPKTRSFAFDKDLKIMKSFDDNSNSAYLLSDDTFNLQEQYSARDVIQQHLNFNQHTLTLKNSLTKQSEIEMVVSGFIKNDINQIYDLKLKGNVGNTISQGSGNIIHNGKYASIGCSDKIVGDVLLQHILLRRTDLTKGKK